MWSAFGTCNPSRFCTMFNVTDVCFPSCHVNSKGTLSENTKCATKFPLAHAYKLTKVCIIPHSQNKCFLDCTANDEDPDRTARARSPIRVYAVHTCVEASLWLTRLWYTSVSKYSVGNINQETGSIKAIKQMLLTERIKAKRWFVSSLFFPIEIESRPP